MKFTFYCISSLQLSEIRLDHIVQAHRAHPRLDQTYNLIIHLVTKIINSFVHQICTWEIISNDSLDIRRHIRFEIIVCFQVFKNMSKSIKKRDVMLCEKYFRLKKSRYGKAK